MGLIFYLSGTPDLKSTLPSEWDLILRKGAHVFEYFMLALLIWWGIKHVPTFKITQVQIASIIAFLYAISDEYHQTFVPGRHGAASDVAIDTVGIILFTAIWFVYLRKKF